MVLSSLNTFDIFGKQVILNYHNHASVKTSFGGCFSILIVVFICLFFWNKFVAFVSKDVVNVVETRQISNDPTLLNLTTEEFMFAIRIQQTDYLKNPYYNITLEQKFYTLQPNGTRLQVSVPLDLEPCTVDHWKMLHDSSNFNETYKALGLNDYLCAKQNTTLKIGGQFESHEYDFLKFSISKCVNVTGDQLYTWKPHCKSYEDAKKYAQQQSVRVQFQMSNYMLNPNEPQNLLKKIISSDLFFQIQPEILFTTADIFFTDYIVKTDNSLSFTSDIQEEIISVQEYGDFRAQYSQYSSLSNKPYSTFFFNRSRFTQNYNRSYMKLQDVLAQLGGFVQFMIAIATIVVGFYNSQFYVLELANKFYDFDIIEDNDNERRLSFQQKKNPSFRKNIHFDPFLSQKMSTNERFTQQYIQESQNTKTDIKKKENIHKNHSRDDSSASENIEKDLKGIQLGKNYNQQITLTQENDANTSSLKEKNYQIADNTNENIKPNFQKSGKNKQIEYIKKQNGIVEESPKGNISNNSDQVGQPSFSPLYNFERQLTSNEDEITNLILANNSNPSNLNEDKFTFDVQKTQGQNDYKFILPSIQEQENEQYSLQKMDGLSEKNNSSCAPHPNDEKASRKESNASMTYFQKYSPQKQVKNSQQQELDKFFNSHSFQISKKCQDNLNHQKINDVSIEMIQEEKQYKDELKQKNHLDNSQNMNQQIQNFEEKEIGLKKQVSQQKQDSKVQENKQIQQDKENNGIQKALRNQHPSSEQVPTCQYESPSNSESYDDDEDDYEEDGEEETKNDVHQKGGNQTNQEQSNIQNERNENIPVEEGFIEIKPQKQAQSMSNINNRAEKKQIENSREKKEFQNLFVAQNISSQTAIKKNISLNNVGEYTNSFIEIDSFNDNGPHQTQQMSRRSIIAHNSNKGSKLLNTIGNPSLPTASSYKSNQFDIIKYNNVDLPNNKNEYKIITNQYLKTEEINYDISSNNSERQQQISQQNTGTNRRYYDNNNNNFDSDDHSENRNRRSSLDNRFKQNTKASLNTNNQLSLPYLPEHDRYFGNIKQIESPSKDGKSQSYANIQDNYARNIFDQKLISESNPQYSLQSYVNRLKDNSESQQTRSGSKRLSYLESKNRNSFISKELIKMNERRKKIQYTFQYIIYKVTCQKFFRTKHNQMVDKAQSLISKDLDIIKILDKIQEIDRIKCLLLDFEQLILFNYFPKPLVQINKDEQIKLSSSSVENIHKNAAEKLNTNQDTIKTVFKATNKFKSLIKEKNKNNIHTIVDYSSYHERTLNPNGTKKADVDYEQIYKAYKQISTKPIKTQIDNLLIELMGQELQNIFMQSESYRNKKRNSSKKFSFTLKSNATYSTQNMPFSLVKQRSDPIKDQDLMKLSRMTKGDQYSPNKKNGKQNEIK